MIWTPRFMLVDNTYDAADEINKPHEDYPGRVKATKDVLDTVLAKYSVALLEHDIKAIHGQIMWDIEHKGMWRPYNVIVGSHVPPHHAKVQGALDEADLFPVVKDAVNPISWYVKFEEIHPFVDGNGRVGGVVLAWLTHDSDTGTMLSPYRT